MIVLRVTAMGRAREVRIADPEAVLGSDPAAAVHETEIGWDPEEASVRHLGDEVLLERTKGRGSVRLRVGDTVRIGHARIALVGLLPLAPTGGPALFGGYDEDVITASTASEKFVLADDDPPSAAPPDPKASAPLPQATAPAPGAPPGPAVGTGGDPRTKADSPAAATPPPPRETKPAAARGKPPVPRPTTPAFREPQFGEELFRQLKRAPFFAGSLGLHVLVFLLLTLFETTPVADTERGQQGSLRSAMLESDAGPEPSDDEELTHIPSPSIPDIPTPRLPDMEDSSADRLPGDQADYELEPLPNDDESQVIVGLQPSVRAAELGDRPETTRPSPQALAQEFGGRDATEVNRRAAEYVRAVAGRGTGRRLKPLETLVRKDLLVVNGTFDKIGRVLEILRLPHTAVKPGDMAKGDASALFRHKVIFWNCGESLPVEQQRIVARRLQAFVRRGGYLFTTDWSVANVLMQAFPGYLSSRGPSAPLPETVVDIRPVAGRSDHPLLAGVFIGGPTGRWWLEQASFDIDVLRRRDVTVLIESPELRDLYGRNPAVAVTFKYGRGRVLHLMGHYYQEAGNLAGAIAVHRLALNFILERLATD